MSDIATDIVGELVQNLARWHGLGQEWARRTGPEQARIRQTWREIVEAALRTGATTSLQPRSTETKPAPKPQSQPLPRLRITLGWDDATPGRQPGIRIRLELFNADSELFDRIFSGAGAGASSVFRDARVMRLGSAELYDQDGDRHVLGGRVYGSGTDAETLELARATRAALFAAFKSQLKLIRQAEKALRASRRARRAMPNPPKP